MNWNANDSKYILKRLIVYILIAFAMFIIGTLKANALTTANDWNNYYTNYYLFNTTDATIPTTQNDLFRDVKGELIMTIYSAPINQDSETLKEVSIQKLNDDGTSTNFICRMGTLSIYSDNQTHRDIITLSCPVDFTNGRLNGIHVRKSGTGTLWLWLSQTISVADTNDNGASIVSNQLSSILNAINQQNDQDGYFYFDYRTQVIPKINDIYNAIVNNNTNITQSINNNTQAINDVNNSINNNDVSGASNDADDLVNNEAFTDSSGLESVIQLPLNMVNSLTNTCQPISITIPFINYTGTIPCMSTIYQQHFGSLYTLLKVVINGFFVYRLLLKVYELVHSAKQPDEDKLEVIDL